ncbi:hypothetical protein TRVA0_007S01706 [Trichomonascus vanleenenianus]|uniref:Trs33p n=1 Tax=Trichomonascus vanleenenianus TaxID=2268995 RepID=UPI003ECAE19A
METQTTVSAAALDLLLIEMVPLAESVAAQLGTAESDDVYFRVEGYGYRAGRGLAEVFTRDRARLGDPLDVMKFICKELWVVLYRKQIDNLKTNHRGTYVLIDNNFKYCQRMATESQSTTLARATPYLWFPMGLIRGVLAGLGIEATVSFDTNQLPGVSFNVQTSRGE